MEIRRLLSILYGYRQMILLMCLSAALTATALTYVLSERYRAHATILIRPQKSLDMVPKREEMLNFPVSFFTPIETTSRTYSEIIKSRAIAERIVQNIGMDKLAGEKITGWRFYWKQAKTGVKSLFKKTWTLLKYGTIRKEDPLSIAVSEVQGGLSVRPIKDTYLFELSADARSSQLAAIIANDAAAVFVEYLRDMRALESQEAREATKDKVGIYQQQLEESKNAVVKYKERHHVASPKKELDLELEALSNLETAQESLSARIKGVMARKAEITRQLAEYDRDAGTTNAVSSPLYLDLTSQLAKKEIELAALSKKYTDEHRDIKVLQAQIREIRSKLDRENPYLKSGDPLYQDLLAELAQVNTDLASLKAESGKMAATIQQKEKAISQMPQREAELSKLEIRASLDEETFRLIAREHEEVGVAANKETPTIAVIQQAVAPSYPVGPIKIYHAALAALLSLISGIGIALASEYTNTSLRYIDETEHGLKLPVLMTIPRLNGNLNHARALIDSSAISEPAPASNEADRLTEIALLSSLSTGEYAEHIRGIRAELQFLRKKQMSTFLIASCSSQEGKSTIASNLAASIAEINKRAVLVDANLRAPSLHTIFRIPNAEGFSDILMSAEVPQWERARAVLTRLPSSLAVLTSGRHVDTPSSLLSSDRLRELVIMLGSNFDFIFIDSPPIFAGPDAPLLAAVADGTIMVVNAGKTSLEDGRRARQILEKVDAKIVGIVMNNYHGQDGTGSGYYNGSSGSGRGRS